MSDKNNKDLTDFKAKTAFVAKVSLLTVLIGLGLIFAFNIFLLIFGAFLFAVFLRSLTDWLKTKILMPDRLALTLVIFSLLSLFALAGWLIAPDLIKEFRQLYDKIPNSIEELKNYLSQFNWTGDIINNSNKYLDVIGNAFTSVVGAVSAVLGMVTNILLVLFIGIYIAFNPELYRNLIIKFFPIEKRKRLREVVLKVEETLKFWLFGQFVGMFIIGVSVTIGLMIMDVPFALSLGFLAAIFNFIPNIGPIISMIPAILIGFTVSPQTAFYVLIFNMVVQTIEGYFLVPLIQEKAVDLPPALTLIVQVFFGLFAGILGVFLATPIAAVALVVLDMLYIQDSLGDKVGLLKKKNKV